MAIIGHATPRSAAAIARVYVESWRSAYAGLLPDRVLLGMSVERQTRDWANHIRGCRDQQSVLVAVEADAGVVGLCTFGPMRVSDLPLTGIFDGRGGVRAVGEIYTLYVMPGSQDRGIGRQLLGAAFTGLCARGFDRACIWTIRDNPARFFYERLGGTPVAAREQRLWGIDVPQTGYGWLDLRRAVERITSYSAT
jgi:ribosomal protein S18 acetylase RimI-like enzyme